MSEQPYDTVPKENLILRDVLARDRTVLANERTLLAYVRTFLTLLLGGASLIQFFETAWLAVAGWMMIALVPFLVVFGVWRYVRVRGTLKRLG